MCIDVVSEQRWFNRPKSTFVNMQSSSFQTVYNRFLTYLVSLKIADFLLLAVSVAGSVIVAWVMPWTLFFLHAPCTSTCVMCESRAAWLGVILGWINPTKWVSCWMMKWWGPVIMWYEGHPLVLMSYWWILLQIPLCSSRQTESDALEKWLC